jgi:hypothetical protein
MRRVVEISVYYYSSSYVTVALILDHDNPCVSALLFAGYICSQKAILKNQKC